MKTQIITVNNRSVYGLATVAFLSAMFSIVSVNAINKPSAGLNAVISEMTGNQVENLNKIPADGEQTFQLEYNAANFVEEEMMLENENWINSENEANVELLPLIKYNAGEYINAEMEIENENWMNSNADTTIEKVNTEIKDYIEYNAKVYVEADISLEIQNELVNNCF